MSTTAMKQYIRGKTWNPRVRIADGDGVPIDMSMYTVKYALKKSRGVDTDYADEVEGVTLFPVTGTGGVDGYLSATILDTLSLNIPKGIYWSEFESINRHRSEQNRPGLAGADRSH